MRRIIFLVWLSLVALAAHADNGTNSLWYFAAGLPRTTNDPAPPIALSASLKTRAGKYFLAFHLVNISRQPWRLYPHALPWGNPYSVRLAAITTDGIGLPNMYLIADPMVESKIVIPPGGSSDGEYDLSWCVDYDGAPKDKDILVLWSYRVPEGPGGQGVACSGVVLIPQRK